jgi:DNA-binding transcriptional LysR family regulator
MELGYAASRGDTGVLSIGYSPWFRPSLLFGIQSAFAEMMPGTAIVLYSAYSATQIELLLRGKLQAGIIELPSNTEGIETQRLWHDEFLVALADNHPLATRSGIDHQDLANEHIISFAKSLNPALHQYLLESSQRWGYVPRIRYEINTISELLDLVGAGAGIGFVKKSIAVRTREPGVVFRELSGPRPFIDTGIAYRADNRSEALQVLVQLLREKPI